MQRRATIAALGVAAFTFLIRIPALSEPRWYYDEGVFTSVAWATSKGLTLYVGVFDVQPPGIFWLFRLLLATGGGDHHIVVQLAVTLFAMASAVLTFAIARRWMDVWPATLAGLLTGFGLSVPAFNGNLVNVELAALPFFLASLLVAFSSRYLMVFLSGALVGVALIFRPSFLIDSVALLVPLFSVGRKELRVLAAGLGLTAALAAAAFGLWAEGSLGAYLSVVAPIDHSYLLNANRGTLMPVYVRLAIFGVIAAVALLRARSTGGRLMALWLPASLAGSTLTPKGYVHFVHEAIPAIALGLAMLAGGYRLRWVSVPAAAVGLLVCAGAQMTIPEWQTAVMTGRPPMMLRDSVGFDPGYYTNWFALATGKQSYTEYSAWFWDFGARQVELERVRSLKSSPGDTLQVLGHLPWMYIESGFLPASPYLNANDVWMVPAGTEVIRRSLRNGCPDVVVVVTDLPNWRDDLNAGGYAPVGDAPWPTFRSRAPHHACK
jgi:hypothetical protein